jgi:hypothetical protein
VPTALPEQNQPDNWILPQPFATIGELSLAARLKAQERRQRRQIEETAHVECT